MVEDDVETILREIRERVYAEHEAVSERAQLTTSDNGEATRSVRGDTLSLDEALARLRSHLATTQRAWDRLPPVVSNRTGAMARFELWIKRHLKRATRWYAWEQINFNSAVNNSLADIVEVLAAQREAFGQQLETQNKLEKALEASDRKLESVREQLRRELAPKIDAQKTQLEEIRRTVESERSTFITELRERDERLTAEQRVCFKQLSLETSEAAALEDRARRKTESELEDLKTRLEQLEKR